MSLGSAQPESDRWFGVGQSCAPDADTAATEAVRAALAGRSASLLLVFFSISLDRVRLAEAIRREADPGTVIAGCSSMGQLHAPYPVDNSVLVVALGGSGFQVSGRIARDAPARRRAAGAEAAACVTAVDRQHKVVLLLSDGLAGEQHELVRGAHGAASSAVPLVGGCAADELAFTRTYQLFGDGQGVEVLSDIVIAVAIGSDAPFGIGLVHGWHKTGDAMMVTKSEGSVLYELDNEPALAVYLRRLGADRALVEDPAAFRAAAFAHPLGLSRRKGEDIRAVIAGNLGDGSLQCLADVPEGGLVWSMEIDGDALAASAAQSCAQAIAGLDGAEPIGLVLFDCGGRLIMLGENGVEREIAGISETAGRTPFGGFYTHGEIARVRGSRGMHHLSVVTLAIA